MALAPDWHGGIARQLAPLRALAPRRVWSSPAARCAYVARFVARRLGVPPVLDPRLLELDFGDWEGRRWDAVPRSALEQWATDPLGFRPPGGESGGALVQRVESFARRLARDARPCLVVSHGGPLRLLPALLAGDEVDLLAPTPEPGRLRIVPALSVHEERARRLAPSPQQRPSP